MLFVAEVKSSTRCGGHIKRLVLWVPPNPAGKAATLISIDYSYKVKAIMVCLAVELILEDGLSARDLVIQNVIMVGYNGVGSLWVHKGTSCLQGRV